MAGDGARAPRSATGTPSARCIRFEQDVFPWIGRRADRRDGGARAAGRAAARESARRHRNGAPHQGRMRAGVPLRHRHRPHASATLPPTCAMRCRRCQPATMPPIDRTRSASAELLRAMDDYAGHPITRAALQLARAGVPAAGRAARRWNGPRSTWTPRLWTIPAAQMKRTNATTRRTARAHRAAGAAGRGDPARHCSR